MGDRNVPLLSFGAAIIRYCAWRSFLVTHHLTVGAWTSDEALLTDVLRLVWNLIEFDASSSTVLAARKGSE